MLSRTPGGSVDVIDLQVRHVSRGTATSWLLM
jgi:hypothetical protein